MMLKSSPTIKKAVKAAMSRMAEGKFDKPKTRADTDALMASRRKDRNTAGLQAAKKDAPNLSALEKEHGEMKSKYDKLGGSNYQYADREQNLSEGERQARSMESGMNQLSNRIGAIKKGGYAKGGKISLKDCSVSTVSKSKKNSDW